VLANRKGLAGLFSSMKPNPDKDLIMSIISAMPDSTETQKREAIKAKCPYSVSSNAYQTWIKAVNNCLKATPSKKAKKLIGTALLGQEQWIAEHML